MTATPVAPLSRSVQASCPARLSDAAEASLCGKPVTWQIGPVERSCTEHVGSRLEQLHRSDPHPFAPYLPTPLRRGKW
jgi:hypothetical protein